MNSEQNSGKINIDYDSGEMSLRDLILAIRNYITYFLSKWYVYLVGIALIVGYLTYDTVSQQPTHIAPLTFTVQGTGGGGGIGTGAILGQLGIGGGGENNGLLKLVELSRSRQVIAPVLFDSMAVEGVNDLLANHLIREYDYHTLWQESKLINGYLFTSAPPLPDDVAGNRVFKQLHRLIVGPSNAGPLLSVSVDEVTSIFTITAETLNEEISMYLAEAVFASLETFHINASVSKKMQTLQNLTIRADSVEALLRVTESQLAVEQDRSARITLRQNSLRAQRLSQKVIILGTMYGEIIKNKETASFLLANEKPSFVVIDEPLVPLSQNRPSLVRAIIIGGVASVLGISVLLMLWKFYFDTIQPINEDVELK